jgi:ketosteroid isomerase-like protein
MVPSIVLAAIITAVPQVATNTNGATERAIAEVEQRFEQALERRDGTELERLLADPFTWLHGLDGRLDSRSVFIANAMRGMGLSRQRNESATFERTVTVYGDAAVVTSRVRTRSPRDERETWFRQSRLYIRSAGGWMMAMGQGTRMYDGPVTRPDLYARYRNVSAARRRQARDGMGWRFADGDASERFPVAGLPRVAYEGSDRGAGAFCVCAGCKRAPHGRPPDAGHV